MKNVSNRPFSFFLGGSIPYDFIVTKPDGTEVWRWLAGKIVLPFLEGKILDPGVELRFEGDWNQQDNQGRPAAAGTYFVRGVLLGELADGRKLQELRLEELGLELKTIPEQVVILP